MPSVWGSPYTESSHNYGASQIPPSSRAAHLTWVFIRLKQFSIYYLAFSYLGGFPPPPRVGTSTLPLNAQITELTHTSSWIFGRCAAITTSHTDLWKLRDAHRFPIVFPACHTIRYPPFAQAVTNCMLYQIALTQAHVSPHGHGEKIRLNSLSNMYDNNRLKHGLLTRLCLS